MPLWLANKYIGLKNKQHLFYMAYLLNDVFWGHINHTHFAGHVHVVRFSDVKPRRTKTISVQDGTDVTTISEGQKSYKQLQNTI